ncbi:MAG TPA: acireductone dioxygenase [Pseudomonas sp.]|nr:acireductone dioxygenase [Pseudomonas sp.]
MSSLTVYHQSSPDLPNKMLTHAEDIASTLAAVGVQFAQLQVAQPVLAGASQDEVIAACQAQIDQLMSEHGYACLDVLSLCDEQGLNSEMRASLLKEQRCAVAQLRYCVAGRGLLSLHIDDYVYALLCEKNDLVVLPAGTRHWFDSGERPRVALIRLFDSPQLPGIEDTGEAIAERFAGLDDCG